MMQDTISQTEDETLLVAPGRTLLLDCFPWMCQCMNCNVICAGELPGVPTAAFTGLPSEKILTLNMDVPEAWLVEPVKAELDLDNLRLADLGGKRVMTAEFELESLILSGSCTDIAATSRAQVSCCEVFLLVCHSTGKTSSGDTSHATPVGNAS